MVVKSKRWTDKEVEILKTYYPEEGENTILLFCMYFIKNHYSHF